MLTKPCQFCGKEFKKRSRNSIKQWEAQKCCSVLCGHCIQGKDPRVTCKDRFFSKLNKGSENECWEWRGSRNKAGYGVFNAKLNNTGSSKSCLAHRYSYQISTGIDPTGKLVMHKCDNPPCCNPSHLTLGTHQDNATDKMMKGRGVCGPSGEKHYKAKLTRSIIDEARRLLDNGESYSKLGKRFGVSGSTINKAILGKTWKQKQKDKADGN